MFSLKTYSIDFWVILANPLNKVIMYKQKQLPQYHHTFSYQGGKLDQSRALGYRIMKLRRHKLKAEMVQMYQVSRDKAELEEILQSILN
jgi:hypothetical protein